MIFQTELIVQSKSSSNSFICFHDFVSGNSFQIRSSLPSSQFRTAMDFSIPPKGRWRPPVLSSSSWARVLCPLSGVVEQKKLRSKDLIKNVFISFQKLLCVSFLENFFDRLHCFLFPIWTQELRKALTDTKSTSRDLCKGSNPIKQIQRINTCNAFKISTQSDYLKSA